MKVFFIAIFVITIDKSHATLCYRIGTGPGNDFPSFTTTFGLFQSLSLGPPIAEDIILYITSDLAEDGFRQLPTIAPYRIYIVPYSPTVKYIDYTGGPTNSLIKLFNNSNVTIDGRYSIATFCTYSGTGTGNYLHFRSTANYPIVNIQGDSRNNTIRNCTFYSNNNNASLSTGGIITLQDNQPATGADNLTIRNNIFRDYNGGVDLFCGIQINASSTTGVITEGLIIQENYFENINGKGIHISGDIPTATVDYSLISGNHFYGNGLFTGPGTGWTFAAVEIETGGGHIIENNYMGGSAPFCLGAPQNISLDNLTNNLCMIRFTADVSVAFTNFIENNIVKNMIIQGDDMEDINVALIRVAEGSYWIGNNIIGDNTVNSITSPSILFRERFNSANNVFRAFYSDSPNGSIVFSNNTIGGIRFENNTANGVAVNLIYSTGMGSIISDNRIGGVLNNIVKSSLGTFRVIYSNGETGPTSIYRNTISGITANNEFNSQLRIIQCVGGNPNPIIRRNEISTIFVADSLHTPTIIGIESTKSGATIDSNYIHTIAINSISTGVQFTGISFSGSTASTITLHKNFITNIISSYYGTTRGSLTGILVTGNNNFILSKNFVSSMSNRSSAAGSLIKGIETSSTTTGTTMTNNVILLDNNNYNNDSFLYGIFDNSASGTNNIWHNSVELQGVSSLSRSASYYKGSGATRNVQNNIFSNKRTGGTGGNYAMYYNTTGGLTENYNFLSVDENVNRLVRYSADRTMTAWQGLGFGANSITVASSTPILTFATGLTINAMGMNVANPAIAVADDYLNVFRPMGAGPDMGAFELDIPLPVMIVSFNITHDDDQNMAIIEWETSYEENNKRFMVERSTDGIHFETIGIVESKEPGTILFNNSITEYSFADKDLPESFKFYYRIKQVDHTGKEFISSMLLLTISENTPFDVNIFPNPALGSNFFLTLSPGETAQREVLLVVYDVNGIERYSKTIVFEAHDVIESNSIDANLDPGIYFIQASSNEELVRKKIIIR